MFTELQETPTLGVWVRMGLTLESLKLGVSWGHFLLVKRQNQPKGSQNLTTEC